MRKLLVILGPTAVGKTSFSISMAKQLNTEIISADSRQFYREMSIGTAAPSSEQLKAVKHHFVGQLSVHDYYNVSMFEQQVLALLDELFKKHDVVIMTGGSGLYIDAVCNGIDELPDVDVSLRNKLKEELDEKGLQYMQERLKALDPEYYELVDLQNPNRILRAIEVSIQTGKPYSSQRQNDPKKRKFTIQRVGLELARDELFSRINNRTEQMIADGLLEEARRLMPYRDLNALNTVGYKELFDFFDGKTDLDEAIEKIKTSTRRYAKRQMTWFQRYEDIHWISPDDGLNVEL